MNRTVRNSCICSISIVLAVATLFLLGFIAIENLSQKPDVYDSPYDNTQIIIEYDFFSRPTVYKKDGLFKHEIWKYEGGGFNETISFAVDWLSKNKIRIYVNGRKKYEDLSYIIMLD